MAMGNVRALLAMVCAWSLAAGVVYAYSQHGGPSRLTRSGSSVVTPRRIATKRAMPEVPDYLKEPGLKVPATAWKWPRTWPFGVDGFGPAAGQSSSQKTQPSSPEEMAVFDARAGDELGAHVARHCPPGAAVLVVDGVGARKTYVPADGSTAGELWFPPSSVEIVDVEALNDQQEADSGAVKTRPPALPFESESFDVVLLVNAAERLRAPRDAFREVWRVLKPGGRAIAAFSSPRCSPAAHADATNKMWRDYNDAQRLWVVGSFFHFSAGAPPSSLTGDDQVVDEVWGAGWRRLRGYDYFDDSDKGGGVGGAIGDALSLGGAAAGGSAKDSPLFVVQADKARAYEEGEGVTAAIDAALWAAPTMEEDDKRLCATRLLNLLSEAGPRDAAERERLAKTVASALPDLYAILKPMQTVIATPLLAQLAANLAPRWNHRATDAQKNALREGLGLDPPRDAFWKPLGAATSQLAIDDKLWLLLDLLPFFDDTKFPTVQVPTPQAGERADVVPEPLALLVPVVLPAALDHVADTLFVDDNKKPLAGMEDPRTQSRDCQLLAVDLVARDYLPDAATDADAATDRFLDWLKTLSKADLKAALDERLAFRETATERARLADLDPEAARQQAEDLRRAQNVEAMLNDIARQLDDRKAKK